MKILYTFLISVILISCTSEDAVNKIVVPGKAQEISVGFNASLETLKEGEGLDLSIQFSKTAISDGFVTLTYTSENAAYDVNFTTSPTFTTEELRIEYAAGVDSLIFSVIALLDDNDTNESIIFTISETSSSIVIGSNATIRINTDDISQPNVGTEDLTVVTWNIEQFAKNGSTTINAVRDIVLNMDADIIALQEMNSIADFNTLVDAIDGWEGKIYDVRGGIELAYLYKTSEISSFSNLSIIFPDDSSPFPRQPVVATAQHVNGLEITFINIHLKCCGKTGTSEANRREAASKALQTYINTNLANDNVIVIGDWNDDIGDGPFDNFISDSDNYLFADMDIATGSSANWSYPSWPSHLDHILISNELMDNFDSSGILKLDQEVSGYTSNVSDHRPVTATFSNN